MSLNEIPGLKVDVESALDLTSGRKKYFDLPAGGRALVRFLPHFSKTAFLETKTVGNILFKQSQHFKVKVDGEDKAVGCLNQHSDEACPFCEYMDAITEGMSEEEERQTRFNKYGPSVDMRAQIIVPDPVTKEIPGIQIVRLTGGTAKKLARLQEDAKAAGIPLFTHPYNGQFVLLTHNGKSGKNSRVDPTASGLQANLNDVFPGWLDSMLDLNPKTLGIKILSRKEALDSLRETIGPVEFDRFFTAEGAFRGTPAANR